MVSKKYHFLALGAFLGLTQMAQAAWFQFPAAKLPGAAKLSVQAERNKIDVSLSGFHFDSHQLKGAEFTEIKLENVGFTSEVGLPKLPVIRRIVEVPADAARVEVLNVQTNTISMAAAGLRHEILPVQLPVEKVAGAYERAVFQKADVAYATDALFPNFQARVVEVGSIRGRHFATVEIAPVRVNPARGEIEYISKISLRVLTAPGAKSSGQQFASQAFDQLLPERQIPASIATAREKLLIIVGRGFENNAKVQELVLEKRALGFEVQTANVSTIGTTALAVRDYIKSVYTSSAQDAPLTYVLLLGDVELVPVYSSGAHITDNYYAAIDKATYNEDRSYPDLAVGRLTAKNANDLTVMIDKILRYDQSSFARRSWIKQIAFLATNDRYQVAEGSHNYVIDTYTRGLGYTGIFPTNPTQGADKLYAITHRAGQSDVMRSVNDGRAIVSYSGHGATTFWDAPRVTQADVIGITHTDALPYVMSHACISGSFGMSGESFGETWIKAPRGAIGFYGTSNNSYWDEDDFLERRWFDGLFRQNIRAVGLLNIHGMQGVRDAYTPTATNVIYYYEIYNLLGDPTVKIWDQ